MNTVSSERTEAAILQGLRSGNRKERSAAIRQLCSSDWVGLARRAVESVNGRAADVEDVFQESLAALVKNVMQGKFEGNSKLSTYFFQICKWRYLKAYQQKELPMTEANTLAESSLSLEHALIAKEKRDECRRLVQSLLSQLGEPCESILKYRKLDYSYADISEELNYDNADTVKNQAARCRKRLRKIIESDPGLYSKIKSFR